MKHRSLLSEVLAVNALLVAATALVATVAVDLSVASLGTVREVGVFALAVLATLLGNALLLRRRFRPLERLVDEMESIDLARPRRARSAEYARGTEEVARLDAAFERMLDRLEAERRRVARAAVEGQERERARIAQDLHDEVNQALTAILLRLEATAQDAPPALAGELRETKRLAGQTMEELLQLARRLRPTVLDDHGLIPALRTQVRDFAEQTGIQADFRPRGHVPTLSREQQLVIYRVTQESLSNVARHAHAHAVHVELSFVGRTVLRVSDDGDGFERARPGGLGLSGMRERAIVAGGRLRIFSGAGRGTRVELTL